MIVVRPALLSDWPDVWPLLEAIGSTDGSDRARERFNTLIRTDSHLIAVAFVDGVAVGYAWVQDRGEHLRSGSRSARLHDLYVVPTHRRVGVGRGLFSSVKEWSERRRVRWLEWQASTAALGFYERLGLRGDPCPDPEHPYFEIEFEGGVT